MADTTNWTDLMNQAGPEIASSFDPIPVGEYDFEVETAENKTSAAGNKYWKIQAKVLGGEFNNRKVWDNLTLTTTSQGALNFFFAKMAVLGLTRAYFNAGPTDEQVSNALVGRRFKAKVKHEIYQGEAQVKIDRYLKPLDVAAPGGVSAPAPVAAAPTAYTPPAPAPAAAPAPPVAAAQPSAAPVQAAGTVPPPPALEGLPF